MEHAGLNNIFTEMKISVKVLNSRLDTAGERVWMIDLNQKNT